MNQSQNEMREILSGGWSCAKGEILPRVSAPSLLLNNSSNFLFTTFLFRLYPFVVMASPPTVRAACLQSARRGMLRSSFTCASPLYQNSSRSLSLAQPATIRLPLYLDFLAPSCRQPSIPLDSPRKSQVGFLKPFRHSFSSTSTVQKVIQNPRKDEDGNEMNIEITPRAANVSP